MPKIELNNGKYIDDQMGNGVPSGGTTGQVLKKTSNSDYDLEWGTGGSSTPAALTSVDDTNVTLTLGGTPATALLQAVSLTLGWTGTLADSRITSAFTWNSKEPGITAGTTSQYWRGDKTWQTFPTIPTVGTWGALNYPTWTSGTPFVKMTAAGTFSLDTDTYYLASNPSGFTNNTGTVTSVAALTLGTSGTDLGSTVADGTTTPVITLNVPTASSTNRGALSSSDWSTFNNKVGTSDTDYEYLMMASFRSTYNY